VWILGPFSLISPGAFFFFGVELIMWYFAMLTTDWLKFILMILVEKHGFMAMYI